MEEIVAHFARNAEIIGVVDVAGVDGEIAGFAVITYQTKASVAGHAYSVATNGPAVSGVVHTVS